jgi:hypothetical protein
MTTANTDGQKVTKALVREWMKRVREDLRDMDAALRGDDWSDIEWWEPCTADAVARWVRVWRRPNGADPDQRNQRPGPWHAIADAGRYSSEQTWCGRRLRGIAQEHTDDPDNDERNDARCIECTRAIGQGRPRAWARR